MINPAQIRAHNFNQISRGAYRAAEVDDFMVELASEFEKILTEKDQLVKKITLLADKIQEYKNEEENIGAVLLNAQKMASNLNKDSELKRNEIIADAENKAKQLEAKAVEKAKEIISSANDKSVELIDDAKKQHDSIVNSTSMDAKIQLDETNRELNLKRDELIEIKKNISELKTTALNMYYTHIANLKDLPSFIEKKENSRIEEIKTPEIDIEPKKIPEAESEPAEKIESETDIECSVSEQVLPVGFKVNFDKLDDDDSE